MLPLVPASLVFPTPAYIATVSPPCFLGLRCLHPCRPLQGIAPHRCRHHRRVVHTSCPCPWLLLLHCGLLPHGGHGQGGLPLLPWLLLLNGPKRLICPASTSASGHGTSQCGANSNIFNLILRLFCGTCLHTMSDDDQTRRHICTNNRQTPPSWWSHLPLQRHACSFLCCRRSD